MHPIDKPTDACHYLTASEASLFLIHCTWSLHWYPSRQLFHRDLRCPTNIVCRSERRRSDGLDSTVEQVGLWVRATTWSILRESLWKWTKLQGHTLPCSQCDNATRTSKEWHTVDMGHTNRMTQPITTLGYSLFRGTNGRLCRLFWSKKKTAGFCLLFHHRLRPLRFYIYASFDRPSNDRPIAQNFLFSYRNTIIFSCTGWSSETRHAWLWLWELQLN